MRYQYGCDHQHWFPGLSDGVVCKCGAMVVRDGIPTPNRVRIDAQADEKLPDANYYSPAMGQVTLQSTKGGYDFRCPNDVETHLQKAADSGLKGIKFLCIDPGAFRLLMSCFMALPVGKGPHPQGDPMRCRATGPDWRTGELLPDCQMPHGHKGECDWKAQLLTDDQLRAEVRRRNLGMCVTGSAADGDGFALRVSSDDELRAECERRGFGPTIAQEAMHLMLVAERNAREVTLRERGLAERDRDEWKRRAQAAETGLAAVAMATADDRPAAGLSAITIDTPEKLGNLLAGARPNEVGPGIAGHRPDNSLAHLDEDLLADDAE